MEDEVLAEFKNGFIKRERDFGKKIKKLIGV